MKRFFETMMIVFESMGKARAAAMFTRMGNYKAAKEIMEA